LQDPSPGVLIQLCGTLSAFAGDLAPDSTRLFPAMAAIVLPLLKHSMPTVQQAVLNFVEVPTCVPARRHVTCQCGVMRVCGCVE
jgi:hypothetical protein